MGKLHTIPLSRHKRLTPEQLAAKEKKLEEITARLRKARDARPR